ncbi:MAG TPA: hypothetical protein EYH41_12665 [Novosphingobium capsulatum]|nr:hypothetical protein [Novosphingobium capsulatum]
MHAELLAELAHAPGAAPVSAALSAAAPSAAGSSVLVQDISIDTLGKIVSIQLLAGPDARTGRRIPLELLFRDVEAVTVDADIIELRCNAEAGVIAYWHLAPGAGTSHIHLAHGHVSIAARCAPVLTRLRH